MLQKAWGRADPPALLEGMSVSTATVETLWRVLRKPEKEMPYDAAVPLLGIQPEKSLQQPKRGSGLNVHQQSKEDMVYIYTVEYH